MFITAHIPGIIQLDPYYHLMSTNYVRASGAAEKDDKGQIWPRKIYRSLMILLTYFEHPQKLHAQSIISVLENQ